MFSERNGRIYIKNNGDKFECLSDEFKAFEPSYQPISTGQIRYWNTRKQYLSINNNQGIDPFYTPQRYLEYQNKIDYYVSLYAEAHPIAPEPPALPEMYLNLLLSGGDEKDPVGCSDEIAMAISGDIRGEPDSPGLPVLISSDWRVTIRKVISTINPIAIDSRVLSVSIVDNDLTLFSFLPIGWESGTYQISEEDFELIQGDVFGLQGDYRIRLLNSPLFFEVL